MILSVKEIKTRFNAMFEPGARHQRSNGIVVSWKDIEEALVSQGSVAKRRKQPLMAAQGILCLIDGRRVSNVAAYVRSVYGLRWPEYLKLFDLPVTTQFYSPEMLVARHEKAFQLRNKPEFALKVEDSVTPEMIYCLLDGEGKPSIKQHVQKVHGMSWEQYREHCGLPRDYPHTIARHIADVEKRVDTVSAYALSAQAA